MCFDAIDLFPVGRVLSLKKEEVATGAVVIAKTGDDGRSGEAEAGDDVDVDEGEEEEESYSEPASSDGGSSSSSCCCCCWSWWRPRLRWWCCMDWGSEPRNVECGIAKGGNGMTSRHS